VTALLNELGEQGWAYAFERGPTIFFLRIREFTPDEFIEKTEADFKCSLCDLFCPTYGDGVDPETQKLPGICEKTGLTTNTYSSCSAGLARWLEKQKEKPNA
jgi:hypothetical protein